MSVTLLQPATAMAPGLAMNMGASGGTGPYTFAVLAGGAGGSIDPSTGVYTAPASMGSTTQTLLDTITVTDSLSAAGSGTIQIGTPIFLMCDIIQRYMNLDASHLYVWDQKLSQPTDSDPYVAVSIMREKIFASDKTYDSSGNSVQTLSVMQGIGIDIISRGSAARDRKEEIVLAMYSDYAEYQMSANSFYIAKLPLGGSFINLSYVDGAAIPYRFHLDVNIQYAVTKTTAVPYYDEFSEVTTYTNP